MENGEKRYQAWVHNKIMALAWLIQRNKSKDKRGLLRHEFFLDEIEHHFMDCDAECKVWKAFRYLRLYLRTYPQKKLRHRDKALEMLELVYERLGFKKSLREPKSAIIG
jgi:hypothetical protein